MINDNSELIAREEKDFSKYDFEGFYIIYYKEIKGLFLLILIILLFSFYKRDNKVKDSTISVCMCVIAKEENRYVREFVEFYKKMKVDKIFLYDNNDINGERFEEVIQDYINNGFVEVINYRGLISSQQKSYEDCYKKNMELYDWFIFFDVDEFIYLKDYTDIKTFLKEKRLRRCERIQFNWVFYTDNNLLYYDNRTVEERFTEKEPNARKYKNGDRQEVKSIVRGHIKNINIHCIHVIDSSLYNCDGFGKKRFCDGIQAKSDYEYYYLKHYYSKSTEEFIEKIMKSDAFYGNINEESIINKIIRYFIYNEITKEKLDLIENRTKLDLSSFRNKIKK